MSVAKPSSAARASAAQVLRREATDQRVRGQSIDDDTSAQRRMLIREADQLDAVAAWIAAKPTHGPMTGPERRAELHDGLAVSFNGISLWLAATYGTTHQLIVLTAPAYEALLAYAKGLGWPGPDWPETPKEAGAA